jgi:hypothetical protein
MMIASKHLILHALVLLLALLQPPITEVHTTLTGSHGQAGFGTPTIDGILNDTIWQPFTNIVVTLANWSTEFPYPPKYNSLNGTISTANDNDHLYIAVTLANLAPLPHLRLIIDDNITETHPQYGLHRGALYWRTASSNWTSANEIWEVHGTPYWSTNVYGGTGAYDLPPDNPYIQWTWTNHTHGADNDYTMEGSFRFRLTPTDPPWLLERTTTYHLHLILDLIVPDAFFGIYTFPPGSPHGGNTETDITNWLTLTCTYHTTPPPTNPWLIAPILAGAMALSVTGLVLLMKRRKKARQEKPSPRPSDP